jgi:hypothetical protein
MATITMSELENLIKTTVTDLSKNVEEIKFKTMSLSEFAEINMYTPTSILVEEGWCENTIDYKDCEYMLFKRKGTDLFYLIRFDYDEFGESKITISDKGYSLDELIAILVSTAVANDTNEEDFFEMEDEGEIKPLDNVDDVKVGDYLYIDGESSFCYGSYQKITKIETRYDEFTGKPYKVFRDDDDNLWSAKTGLCISGGLRAYSIYGYGRKSK